MDSSDGVEFNTTLNLAYKLADKDEPSGDVKLVWWRLLKSHGLQEIKAAFQTHAGQSRFAPKPADIIGIIQSCDGRPTAEEAWATALASSDESQTIVWTDEISQSLSMGAGDLLTEGDKTAARMAFRDSYTRLVTQARESGLPVKVWVSQGHDKHSRNAAIEQAAAKGLLTQDRANELMIEHKAPEANGEYLRLVGSTISEKDKEKRLEKLGQLKELLA